MVFYVLLSKVSLLLPSIKQDTPLSWKNIVVKNTVYEKPQFSPNNPVSFNEDGSANIHPPEEFLINAKKQWSSSLIGHFIGGGFAFNFVKEQAFKLWKNLGLLKVYFSSKGYYTFKFNTVEEKDFVLGQYTAQMGGKTLYLRPWMEGSKFQRNSIDRVPCWIKLVDVPQSYWSASGLSHIAQAVGTPLKFDVATARLEPIKFAGVQVELQYSSPKPDIVWVPILHSDGSSEKLKVEIVYPRLPSSCSICKAFGHSLARCPKNPDANNSIPKKPAANHSPKAKKDKVHKQDFSKPAPFKAQLGSDPPVIGQFLGCDVVQEEDELNLENELLQILNEEVMLVCMLNMKDSPDQNEDLQGPVNMVLDSANSASVQIDCGNSFEEGEIVNSLPCVEGEFENLSPF